MSSDTQIHHTELLLTLDYLLKHTDKDHPATQVRICEYAREYGLKFDKSNQSGNDVKLQRVGKCLSFLYKIAETYPDEMPFVLEKTNGGKYYIESKHALNEEQIAQVLAAIKNDKYTADSDTTFLTERILDAFTTSRDHRETVRKEAERLYKGVPKFEGEDLRRIRCLETAYCEGKIIRIWVGLGDARWYRVYMLKENKGRLYAFLLPAWYQEPVPARNYIFKEAIKIPVCDGKPYEVLTDDPKPNRSSDHLFWLTNPALAEKYGSLDEFIIATKKFGDGKPIIATFSFSLDFADLIERSYREYFFEPLRYQKTNFSRKEIKAARDTLFGLEDCFNVVKVDDGPNKEEPHEGLANIHIDVEKFKGWLLSSPYHDSQTVADFVTIIKPTSLANELLKDYCDKLLRKVNDLPLIEEQKDLLYDLLVNAWAHLDAAKK